MWLMVRRMLAGEVAVASVSGVVARKNRKIAFLGGGAVSLVLFASSAAQAQCIFTGFDFGGSHTPVFGFMVGTAATINSAISIANTAFLTQTSAFLASPQGTQPDQFAGGVWVRGVGGEITLDATSIGSHSVTDRFGRSLSGATSCAAESRSSFGGVQGGIDWGRLDLGNSGWNVHLGLTAGYLTMDNRQSAVNAKADVPFLGVYAAAVYGNFFFEAQVRGDLYQLEMSDPSSAIFGLRFAAYGFGVSTSAGYNIAFGNFFIEPSVGLVFSRTTPDAVLFTAVVPVVNAPTPRDATFTGTFKNGTVETLLGRVGARVGTSFAAGGLSVQPFLAASVWHDFADEAGSAFAFRRTDMPGLGGAGAVTGNFITSGVGTYGQYSIGFAAVMPNTPWLGYARFDYRNGENIDGWSINGGIRYQFAP
jgi:hypothetical protein